MTDKRTQQRKAGGASSKVPQRSIYVPQDCDCKRSQSCAFSGQFSIFTPLTSAVPRLRRGRQFFRGGVLADIFQELPEVKGFLPAIADQRLQLPDDLAYLLLLILRGELVKPLRADPSRRHVLVYAVLKFSVWPRYSALSKIPDTVFCAQWKGRSGSSPPRCWAEYLFPFQPVGDLCGAKAVTAQLEDVPTRFSGFLVDQPLANNSGPGVTYPWSSVDVKMK